jgi:hypothetical protein
MIDFQAIEDSKKLYDSAKEYFAPMKLDDCVIEISDKPMSEWVIHFTKSDDEMSIKRFELADLKKSFIAIYCSEEGAYFFFTDFVTSTLELTDQKKIIFSDVNEFEDVDREKLVQELKELKNVLRQF